MNRSRRKKYLRREDAYLNKMRLAGLISLVLAAPAFAHHSFPAEFDRSRSGVLAGTIVEVWYKNPHARYRMEVTAEDGSVEEWDIQTTSVTSLRRIGWSPDTLQVGDSVRVSGDLGHGNTKKLFMRKLVKNGVEYLPFGPVRTAEERSRIDASAGKDYGYGQLNPDHPFDISGPWHNGYKFRLTVDDLEPKPTPYTAEGRRIFEATESWHDNALRCMPLGLPRTFGSPYALDIVDAGSHYMMVFEQNNTPRWVWMDGRTLPPGLPPNSMGFSVGHWEDDVLVIETTNLTPGTLDGSLMPMSGNGTRIVEHWAFSDDRLSMDRTMTVYDPYYTEPLIRKRGSARQDSQVVYEPAPCDADGYYRDLYESGRLEEHLEQ